MNYAPGWPGIAPRWTSSNKAGIGTSLSSLSRVWFTLSHGILNEVYYPRVDQACTRDFGFLIADGNGFFSEEKRDAEHRIEMAETGVPAYRLQNRCLKGHYLVEKQIVSDPRREVVLQRIRFSALDGPRESYRLYGLLAPHLVNGGAGNTAWLGDYKGDAMLFAEGDGTALALACSTSWAARSVGFVGVSDGWQDLARHGRLTWSYDRAENGNVALTGDLALGETGEAVIALGFGRSWSEAALRARASLQDGFEAAHEAYCAAWRAWQKPLRALDPASSSPGHNAYRISTAVVRAHESPSFPGGFIASLSIPWGFSKGDDDLGGYHLIWPRDLVESAGGLLAAGASEDATRVLEYLQATQDADGHWPQNAWLDGTPYWQGIQMDECAFPILLVDLLRREAELPKADIARYWPMVESAARYILLNGPVTCQDRWEEDAGYSPFTLAVEIAALLAAADLAELQDRPLAARTLRETADCWNEEIEWWTYVAGTELAQRVGVAGYYVRIAPAGSTGPPVEGTVAIKNRPASDAKRPAAAVVSPDALALVRFGLRAADDPRIRDTIKVIDALLKVDLPAGPCWRRYNGDGYGEQADGAPFDGTGIGRAWPLLTGERAHYEIAAGALDRAATLLTSLEAFVSEGGLIPEQVWDAPDIPERELFLGKPTGSAMPLVWAHAEHLKLRRSLADRRVFDQPPQPVQRYQIEKRRSATRLWRLNSQSATLPAGRRLRLELANPSLVHWTRDGWRTAEDLSTGESELGLHVAELPTAALTPGDCVVFTLYRKDIARWAGANYELTVV